MLSPDEIQDGMTFILKLWDNDGVPWQWAETLRGDVAKRWYDVYRRSDWNALRTEGGAVFTHQVSGVKAEEIRTCRQRCIYMHTKDVKANDLGAPARSAPVPSGVNG